MNPTHKLDYLRYGDLVFVVERETFSSDETGGNEYWYNEHTCPTNWIGEVVDIFKVDDTSVVDTDPHGEFRFMGTTDSRGYKPTNDHAASRAETEARVQTVESLLNTPTP